MWAYLTRWPFEAKNFSLANRQVEGRRVIIKNVGRAGVSKIAFRVLFYLSPLNCFSI